MIQLQTNQDKISEEARSERSVMRSRVLPRIAPKGSPDSPGSVGLAARQKIVTANPTCISFDNHRESVCCVISVADPVQTEWWNSIALSGGGMLQLVVIVVQLAQWIACTVDGAGHQRAPRLKLACFKRFIGQPS